MFGALTPRQAEVVRAYVSGKRVADLGAGDLRLSRELLRLGAIEVDAIDRHLPARAPKRIHRIEAHFHDWRGVPEVAFVSWPVNWEVGLPAVLRRAPTVIYLGTNVGGTVCGDEYLWRYLTTREVLAYEPDPSNSLIVYGPKEVERRLVGEEWAGLDHGRLYTFEEAEAHERPRRVYRAV